MSSSFKRRGKKSSARPAAPRPPASADDDEASRTPVLSERAAAADGVERSPSCSKSSSRRRRAPTTTTSSSSLLPGTKPWTNGLTLTSFGLREIDSFLFSSGGGGGGGGNEGGGGGGGGGGQPLRTFATLEEDRLADDLARALCRCWCAEGVAQRQLVLLGSFLPSSSGDAMLDLLDDGGDFGGRGDFEGSTPEELGDFVTSLPRNLHLDKFRDRAKRKDSSASSENADGNLISGERESISAIIEEEEEGADDDGDGERENGEARTKDEGLVNAWQYRKSVQDARSGIGSRGDDGDGRTLNGDAAGDGVYCHSYDLSKRMWDQFECKDNDSGGSDDGNAESENPLVTNTKIVDCSRALWASPASNNDGTLEYQRRGMALFRSLWKHVQSALSDHPNTVIRLFLRRLPVGHGAVAMPLLMAKIRKENLPVVVLATLRPWRWLSSSSPCDGGTDGGNKLDALASLRSAADVALSLDSFSSLRAPPPPEFSLLHGVLTVRKCASFAVSHYTDTVAGRRPLAERFGAKRDGRKVTVQLLHLPPEEYSRGGSSTSGVRSGGGSHAGGDGDDTDRDGSGGGRVGGCSSLGGGGASLDF